MSAYLPYIFGIPSLIGGLYLFLFSFRIHTPKHTIEKQEERYENTLDKYGTLMKIASILFILSGSYDLIFHNPNRYMVGNKKGDQSWTIKDRTILIQNCLRDAGPTSLNFPEITKDYCDCSVDKIMKALTKDQYEKSLAKPQAEQMKEILPIFQKCLDELKHRVDSVDKEWKFSN
ncbi:MAG: hypothetical protein HYZ42_04220, partial [Bacteroidetes bacterium]|nr:hypothetical protein [Bacteroidota bacterium]